MDKTIQKIISAGDLRKALQGLLSGYDIFAPVAYEGNVLFEKVQNSADVVFEYNNTLRPPKEILIPPRETLFCYTKDNKIENPSIESKPFIIWGIRPCDVKSFSILDEVFGGDYVDPYYKAKRDSAILIGFGCSSAMDTCLCTSFDDDGPQSTKGTDALVTPLNEKDYFLEIITEKGKHLLEKYGSIATEEHIRRKKTVHEEAIRKIKRKLDVPDNMGQLFNHKYWDEASQKCLSCGICRYLCPTCHCFSLVDEEKKKIKYCDACSFKLFTKEGAGHNPRKEKASRYKQWYYHKFEYHKIKADHFLCVGCGRCTIHCPVNIDFAQVLKDAPKDP